MPTRTEIRDLVRTQTLVEVDDLTDSKVDNLINQAIRDVSVRFNWPFLAKTDTIAIVNGTDTYAFPTDADRIQAILLTDSTEPLEEVSAATGLAADGLSPSTGTPSWFFIWGEQFILRPVPDADTTLTVYYFRKPTVLTNDGDSPEFAEQFHYVLTDFVMQQLWEREEDFEKGNVYKDRYTQGVEQMARYYLNRAVDQPIVIGEPKAMWSRKGPRMPWLEV